MLPRAVNILLNVASDAGPGIAETPPTIPPRYVSHEAAVRTAPRFALAAKTLHVGLVSSPHLAGWRWWWTWTDLVVLLQRVLEVLLFFAARIFA